MAELQRSCATPTSWSERQTARLALLLWALVLVWTPGCREVSPRASSTTLQQPTITRLLQTLPPVALTPQDRILILAPHPDDEMLCCGGLIQDVVARRLPVRIVFLTYGDNNEWSFIVYRKRPVLFPSEVRSMGLVRHDEAVAASKALGLSSDHLTFLGYPDFGTLNIWNAHWADRKPFQSMLTRVTAVPYSNAARPGAPYKGEEIVKDLTTVLREFHPTKVFVSHPGDHMPDHRALYLFTRVALWNVEGEIAPEVYPYLIHFGPWPQPRGYHPKKPLTPPKGFVHQISWWSNWLLDPEVPRKRIAVEAHRTQVGYSAPYLLAFVRPNELFGDFLMMALRSRETPIVPSPSQNYSEQDATRGELPSELPSGFVGFGVSLEHQSLVLSIASSEVLDNVVEGSVDLYGYRAGTPFASMPKLHIKFGSLGYMISDQTRRLPQETLQVIHHGRYVTLRIPLSALGQPQHILASTRTYHGRVSLDRVSWRTIDLPRQWN